MSNEPVADEWGFVGGGIVEDEVNVEILGNLVVDRRQELAELLRAMPAVELRQYRSRLEVKRGEEIGRPAAFVVVGSSLRGSRAHRQEGLRAIQGLNLGLIAMHFSPRVQLFVGAEQVGSNPKVNNLIRAYRAASSDWALISDSNARMERGFLRALAGQFVPGCGLVNGRGCREVSCGCGWKSRGSLSEHLVPKVDAHCRDHALPSCNRKVHGNTKEHRRTIRRSTGRGCLHCRRLCFRTSRQEKQGVRAAAPTTHRSSDRKANPCSVLATPKSLDGY